MTWRSARRGLLAAAAVFALLLAVPFVKNARVYRRLHRIADRGGMVLSWSGSPVLAWMPAHARSHAESLYVIRASYDVRVGEVFIGCGTGITLWMGGEGPPTTDGDAALAELPGLPNVVRLDARKSMVTDAGLRPVGALSALTQLTLEQTAVTGAGFVHLRGLPLARVSLEGSPVDDAGLVALDELPALEWLGLSGTRVTGAGLSHLGRFPALAGLDLSRTRVDDDALRHLVGLHLTMLGLADTAVSDAGIEHLERLADLQQLWLCGSRVSEQAAARSTSQAVRASLQLCKR